jgi:hypothetical protein
MADGRWQMADGKSQMTDGKWGGELDLSATRFEAQGLARRQSCSPDTRVINRIWSFDKARPGGEL